MPDSSRLWWSSGWSGSGLTLREQTHLIVSKLFGGLGNQLFQYAAGYSAAQRAGTTLKMDPSGLLSISRRETGTHRRLELLNLVPTAEIATGADLRNFPFSVGSNNTDGPISAAISFAAELLELRRGRRSRLITEALGLNAQGRLKANLSSTLYLSGYWTSPDIFSDCHGALRKTIMPLALSNKLEDLTALIERERSGIVHVRRTDFVERHSRVHQVTNLDYFMSGLAELRARGLPIFVFSDDLEWCKSAFGTTQGLHFVERSSSERDSDYLWAMSKGAEFVISNSSFSWWAAWISEVKDKVVFRPNRWTNRDRGKKSVYPPDWKIIDS